MLFSTDKGRRVLVPVVALVAGAAILIITWISRGNETAQPNEPASANEPGRASPSGSSGSLEQEDAPQRTPAPLSQSGTAIEVPGGRASKHGTTVSVVSGSGEQEILETGELEDDKRTGAWRVYRHDGSLWMEKEYRAGRLEGRLRVWGDGDHVREESYYRAGLLEGVSKSYWDTGQVALSQEFHAGKRDGPFGEWDEAGRVITEAQYRKGNLTGRCVFYSAGGTIDSERSGMYQDGVRVSGL